MNNKSFISNQTICLLCGFKPLVVKKFIIERHFRTRHLLEYSNYSNTEKLNIIEGLKLVYQEGALPPSINSSSQKSVLASYAISLLIAQNAKPFSEGVFVKNCIIEAVKAFGNSLTLEEAMSIPLSSKTNDFSCVEELLDFVPLHGTTTGLDIFLAVQKSLEKFGVDLNKCSSITTDGARNMTGLKIGFAGQLKQRNSNIPVIHCIIHQEALSGKVVQLSTTMATVSKIINLIKGGHKFLTHRKFQLFLQEHNAVHTDVPLDCPVRWLSAAKCLETFFSIRKEILLFLQEGNNPQYQEYISHLEDITFLSELAFITDITNQLRLLNLKLQRTNQSISQLVSHVDSFRRKLQLLKSHLNNDVFRFSPSCEILLKEYGNSCNFKEYIHFVDCLIEEFDTRFICFENLEPN
ncbi:general transcription factor II-I repeat domain-containing protein 2B-like [Osmia bicornis bicornis]|uniref:general transcription factor II-I repeat domain-containing protein 2B-like n=1 Tax=Osmia bicornis bicornis TaxID=1437191 RepID=UPI001EAF61CD|nr:general transcription factor II-I repeat domain-containing protein 2B-like [Osmia bicornis bicornis]